ncbi:MAG: hypothetical protein WB870_06760, partial [Gallionellaceae bacterium]
ANSIRDRGNSLTTNPDVWLQSLTFSKSSIESLAKVGVHVCYLSGGRDAEWFSGLMSCHKAEFGE